MAAGYRSGGVDFDQMFEPGALANWGFRRAGGGPTQYAPRNGIAPRPNTGYRNPNGTDVANDWLPLGSAPPVPGFNGRSYSASAIAPTSSQGTTSATVALIMLADGTWIARRTLAGAGSASGTTTIETGTWLPAGQSPGNFTIRFAPTTDPQITIGNEAPTDVPLSTQRSMSVTAAVPSNSTESRSGTSTVTTYLTRVGAGTTIATFTLGVSAIGWQ